jgi:hypothetical protein
MSNTDKSFLIGLNIHHKDGTAGEIIQFIQNKPGYFMVRFKDGVTVAQSGNKLFYNSISVNELEKNDLVILESSLNQNISEENSSFKQFEHEILKTLTLDVPITMILGEAGTGKSDHCVNFAKLSSFNETGSVCINS